MKTAEGNPAGTGVSMARELSALSRSILRAQVPAPHPSQPFRRLPPARACAPATSCPLTSSLMLEAVAATARKYRGGGKVRSERRGVPLTMVRSHVDAATTQASRLEVVPEGKCK